MNHLPNLFDALYERFIARDFLAKIGPGLLLIGVLTFSVAPRKISFDIINHMSAWVWVAVLAWAWLAGFIVQGFGVIAHLIIYFPTANSEKDYEELRAKFLQRAGDNHLRQGERLRLVKEACGNAYVTLILALVVLLGVYLLSLVDRGWSDEIIPLRYIIWPLTPFAVVATISLRKLHIEHVNYEWNWMKYVLILKDMPTSKPAQPPRLRGSFFTKLLRKRTEG